MDRDAVLAIIDAAYATRMRGDPAALAAFWAEGATFQIAGDNDLLAGLPFSGRAAGPPSVAALMELIEFTAIQRIDAVVEGHRAAVLSRATMSFSGRPAFDTTLYDLFELDEAGKVTSVLQFIDTARLGAEFQALAG